MPMASVFFFLHGQSVGKATNEPFVWHRHVDVESGVKIDHCSGMRIFVPCRQVCIGMAPSTR